ncbi:MAG: hypothetical protein RR966_14525 [Acinetobacter sp.]
MMKLKVIITVLFSFGIISSVHADMFKPSHYCTKPTKPYKFTSDWEVKQYFYNVEKYQRCISEFVDKQNKEIQNHQKATQDAIEEWNRYVQYELK